MWFKWNRRIIRRNYLSKKWDVWNKTLWRLPFRSCRTIIANRAMVFWSMKVNWKIFCAMNVVAVLVWVNNFRDLRKKPQQEEKCWEIFFQSQRHGSNIVIRFGISSCDNQTPCRQFIPVHIDPKFRDIPTRHSGDIAPTIEIELVTFRQNGANLLSEIPSILTYPCVLDLM